MRLTVSLWEAHRGCCFSPLRVAPSIADRQLCDCMTLRMTVTAVRACIYDFMTPTRSFGSQLIWPVSSYQPTWAAYTHASLCSCLHRWSMTALSKVNMKQFKVLASVLMLSLFLLLILFCHISLAVWHIFKWQIPFQYPSCIFLLFVFMFAVLFHFFKYLYIIHVHKMMNPFLWFCKFVTPYK